MSHSPSLGPSTATDIPPDRADGADGAEHTDHADRPHRTGSGDGPQVLAIGALAVDVICDCAAAPTLHTSNLARIDEALGGVAANVAYAAQLAGVRARLVTVVGRDVAGRWACEQLRQRGMDLLGVRMAAAASTARYVCVNDARGRLLVAGADMAAVEALAPDAVASALDRAHLPALRCVVVDANLRPETIAAVIAHCRGHTIPGPPPRRRPSRFPPPLFLPITSFPFIRGH